MRLTDKQFDLKQNAVTLKCAPNLVSWGIPSGEFDKLTDPKGNWDTYFEIGGKHNKDIRSKKDVERKDRARIVYEPVFNKFVTAWVRNNPLIPDDKKIEMYIHINTGVIQYSKKPTTFPTSYRVDSNVRNQLTITVRDSDNPKKRGKKKGVLRLELWVFIEEMIIGENNVITYTKPKTDEDYIHWGDDSTTMKGTAKFPMRHAGKGVYIRPRFANNKGGGPAGEAIHTTIPR